MTENTSDEIVSKSVQEEERTPRIDFSRPIIKRDFRHIRRAKVHRLNPLAAADAVKYAMCLFTSGYNESLKPLKIYPVLPDETAETHGWVRIIDDQYEDMLYMAEDFALVEMSEATQEYVRDAFTPIVAEQKDVHRPQKELEAGAIGVVVCINNDGYKVSLEKRKLYFVLPTDDTSKTMIRIVDETGEDYLFERERFVEIKFADDEMQRLRLAL